MRANSNNSFGRSGSSLCALSAVLGVALVPCSWAQFMLHYVDEDARVCDHTRLSGGDPRRGVCTWGQCCVHTRGCYPGVKDQCVEGQGTCMQRLANQTDVGEPASDANDVLDDPRYRNGDTLSMVVRYCRCEPGFVGPLCEIKMDWKVPLLYVLVGYCATTWLLFVLLDAAELLQPPRLKDRQIRHSIAGVKVSQIILKCLSFVVESFMMSSGVFSYSVQWSTDFALIAVLRLAARSIMEAFTVFAHSFLPDSWSSRDTFSIQVMFSTTVPMMLLAQAWSSRVPDPTTGKMELTARGSTIIYTVLPLFTIPVVGVLFKPIVSCHLQAGLLQPAQPAAEDEYFTPRSAPPEELFLPPSERTDCSFGKATANYFWLGFCLLVPFWLVGIYFSTSSAHSEQQRFPMLKGYHAWHTQLLVGCAFAYRAFKRHHPELLCWSLLALNTLELGLLWRWRPCNMRALNLVRVSAHSLAVVWCIIGVIAASIGDSADDTSGILLLVSMFVWSVVVIYIWQRRKTVVGVAGTTPQTIGNDVGNALPDVHGNIAGPTFEMEGENQVDPLGQSSLTETHRNDRQVVVGSVLNVSFESTAMRVESGTINTGTSNSDGGAVTTSSPNQHHERHRQQEEVDMRLTEATANPLASTSAEPEPAPLSGTAARPRFQLSPAELQARKERSDRARANMRKKRGRGTSVGGRSGLPLDINELLERQEYLRRPEVDRFLSGLGELYAGYWPLLQENGWDRPDEMDLCSESDLQDLGVKPGHAKLIVARWERYRNGEASSFMHKHRGVPH